jgi:hypothetical protein
VHDAFAVCSVDRVGQRLYQVSRLTRRPGLAFQAIRQAVALDPFHGQERPALVAADLIDLHNVRMVNARSQLCL